MPTLRCTLIVTVTASLLVAAASASADEPNIVVVLADDLGYGDVAVNNPDSPVPTPNVDRIASEGMRFTDGHSSAAVCTPTRYTLLTGRYSWRTRLKSGVLGGYSAPLIGSDRATIASVLREEGYHTGVVGKWHLGLGWPTKEGTEVPKDWSRIDPEKVAWNEPLKEGPHTVGFAYSYIFPASLDMAPYVYVHNGKVTQEPTARMERRGFPRFVRDGVRAPDLHAGETLDHLTERAVGYIERRADGEKPFFLYFALTAPHKPVWPAERFRGRSGVGPHGDFVMQVDWTVGRIDRALREAGVDEETLLVVTSDNGSYMREVAPDQPGHSTKPKTQGYRVSTHRANGDLRGRKADIYEGGHRVPFIVRWPGEVDSGVRCDQPVSQVDLLATFADVTGAELSKDTGEDSFSFLPLLRGKGRDRPPMVHRSGNGTLAIRDRRWKLVLSNGSGGRTNPRGQRGKRPYQLYDMRNDPLETTNLVETRPKVAKRLEQAMEKIRTSGRTPQ